MGLKIMAKQDASERALEAAKAFVAYIEFFRTHGTGDTLRRYPDDDAMGGYDNIARRAHELANAIEDFDGRREDRQAEAFLAMCEALPEPAF